jgi:hypothetical protein
MNPSTEFVRALDSVEPLDPTHRSFLNSTRFRYRAAIGELMWSMITTRTELSYPVIKFSQFATNPATIHYDAIYGIFLYFSGMHNDGITYTHQKPLTWGPIVKHTHLHSQPTNRVNEHVPKENLNTLYG